MSSEDIRKNFLNFFKKRGHTIVPSSSLIPDDPSVLLTTAGMQQFKRYFIGELDPLEDFGSKNTASIQKSFRTSDIDEVGDESHLTFFEMLGHFSFGGYFKEETINWTFELLTKVFGVAPERVRVAVFRGDNEVPSDEESFRVWSKILSPEKISRGSRQDNFWGPAGTEGPCGACNEVYVDNTEVATLVFMEYHCRPDKSLEKLKQKGVDVGWGFERITALLQGTPSVFETDLLYPLVSKIRELAPHLDERIVRILADHSRATVFLIGDGLLPSNKEAGYVLRRLIRRILAYQIKYDIHANVFPTLLELVSKKYSPFYPELKNKDDIFKVFENERFKFQRAIQQGISEIERLAAKRIPIDGLQAFNLYQTFSIPFELTLELAPVELTKNLKKEDFDREFKKHQEISRTGAESKFRGGLADTKPETIRLHTAHHLLLKALQVVLGPHVKQRGSNITSERLRMDFVHGEKMTEEQKRKVEEIVNEKIAEDLPVIRSEMALEEAEKLGAEQEFGQKYPERVSVYSIGPKDATPENPKFDEAFSIEFCGGPHVERTGVIGKFKILKEEAVAAGIRRIRATVE